MFKFVDNSALEELILDQPTEKCAKDYIESYANHVDGQLFEYCETTGNLIKIYVKMGKKWIAKRVYDGSDVH